MQTCLDFKDTQIQGDPVIPLALYQNYNNDDEQYNTATDNPSRDCNIRTDISDYDLVPQSTKRRQKPYPGSGNNYATNYDTLASSYVFEVVPGSFAIDLGVDANPADFPQNEAEIIMTMNLDMQSALILYSITWTNSTPYDYNNPPVIITPEFGNGIEAYWNSCTYTHRNCVGLDSTIGVVKNLNTIGTNTNTFITTNSSGPESHDLLCTEIKSQVLLMTWGITETLPDEAEEPDQGLDTHATLTYSVRLIET